MSKYILLIILIVLLFTPQVFAGSNNTIRLIDDGNSAAIIVIAKNASKQLRRSALELQRYFNEATGCKLPVVSDNVNNFYRNSKIIKIWVGHEFYKKMFDRELSNMDDDGFVIAYPDSSNIVIAGPSDWGTEFGVYGFLERFLGVRWLFPGPQGEHIPNYKTLEIQIDDISEEPYFLSRQISGLLGTDQIIWARHNRMHGKIKFHHNLYRIFPPKLYSETHPEFFPIRNGKRYIPADGTKTHWQPCFLANGIVEEAIENISYFFTQHPNESTYSLGVNDGGGFCEEYFPQDHKKKIKKNFLGFPNYSDHFFLWASAVANGVLQEHPDKWFGCLAYRSIAEPPAIASIHPRIVPFITTDRMRWISEQSKFEGKRLNKLWADKTSVLGWYDYFYGTPYLIPRIYFNQMAENYRFAFKNGIKAVYAEAYPNFGEGPKLYLALKLLWNPEIDVDTCLNDWYVSAVGNDAAPYLAAYYELWNSFWTAKIVNGKWFKRKGQIMKFWYPDYLDLVTYNDIHRSRKLLETTLAKTKTEKQRSRALIFLRAFEYYEASVISYLGLVKGTRTAGKDEHFYEQMVEKRLLLLNQFQDHPVLAHPIRFDDKRFQKLRWGKKSKLGYFEGIKEKLVEILAK